MTITCFYSCEGCDLVKQPVDVDAREHGEDVADWMRRTVSTLSADHRRRSPFCTAKVIQEVRVPITGADR